MKKVMQVIALAVLLAGTAGLSSVPSSDICYYDDNCGCNAQRDDAIEVANRARDKRISGCTDAFCIEQVFREHREWLDQIERNYQLCLSLCHIEWCCQ